MQFRHACEHSLRICVILINNVGCYPCPLMFYRFVFISFHCNRLCRILAAASWQASYGGNVPRLEGGGPGPFATASSNCGPPLTFFGASVRSGGTLALLLSYNRNVRGNSHLYRPNQRPVCGLADVARVKYEFQARSGVTERHTLCTIRCTLNNVLGRGAAIRNQLIHNGVKNTVPSQYFVTWIQCRNEMSSSSERNEYANKIFPINYYAPYDRDEGSASIAASG